MFWFVPSAFGADDESGLGLSGEVGKRGGYGVGLAEDEGFGVGLEYGGEAPGLDGYFGEEGSEGDFGSFSGDGAEAGKFLFELGFVPLDDAAAGFEEDEGVGSDLGGEADGFFEGVGFGKGEGEGEAEGGFGGRGVGLKDAGLASGELAAEDSAIAGEEGDVVTGA